MPHQQIDRLDTIAHELLVPGSTHPSYGPLSTGERLYVAMAANRHDLLSQDGYTMAQAMSRIGPDWLSELISRWQYA